MESKPMDLLLSLFLNLSVWLMQIFGLTCQTRSLALLSVFYGHKIAPPHLFFFCKLQLNMASEMFAMDLSLLW